jgi:hypothetical protein
MNQKPSNFLINFGGIFILAAISLNYGSLGVCFIKVQLFSSLNTSKPKDIISV